MASLHEDSEYSDWKVGCVAACMWCYRKVTSSSNSEDSSSSREGEELSSSADISSTDEAPPAYDTLVTS